MVNIALIGATGSIGRQVAEVVSRYPEQFRFSALASSQNGAELLALANKFRPAYLALASGEKLVLPEGSKQLFGEEIASGIFEGADIALIAASGFAGLYYTLAAIEAGKTVALANKESLVCGGELVTARAREKGVTVIPVDSEHSALFQALSFRTDTPFARLILTASGGPFRNLSKEELQFVTAADALKHPTWKMGKKITIDCATLLNKGYEVIEAHWLYNAPYEKIEAVVHPESIIHSIVCFEDGAAIAQMGYPDMRLPIQLALTYPKRLPCEKQLDFVSLGSLRFEWLQSEKFPCFELALQTGKAGGTLPTALNASAEVAVNAFLQGSITFPQIAETIERTLQKTERQEVRDYETLALCDASARKTAMGIIYGK